METSRIPGVQPVEFGATPVVLVRLKTWQIEREEIEPGTFRAGHVYRDGMSSSELVDSTRAWWRIDRERVEREGIRHAVAVHQRLTRAVVEIGNWKERPDGRRAFSATLVTEGSIFDEWVGLLGRKVCFARGDQYPIRYSTSM